MQRIQHSLCRYLDENGITITYIAKATGIKYELLRRSLKGNRVLTADELAAILTKTKISLEDIIS